MASSRQSRRRRQQASFRRHQLRLEGLEKRYALNAAPVLDDSASPTLGSILEDTGTPVGPAGTLVSDLIDAGGPLNNFSDVDGDQPGIAITDTKLQGGALWYSRDDGVSWFDVGVLSNAQPLLMPAVTGSRLYYEPAPDFNGTIADVFTIKAWDQHTVLEQIGEDVVGEAVGDLFGTGVSLSADGTTVAIGGYKNGSNGRHSGHVRVFQWNGSAWSQLGDDLLGIGADEKFGYRICISDSGDRIAVSAFSNSNGWDSGMVQIYQWNGLSWQQLGENLVGNAGDLFGHALATSANVDVVVAGAYYGGYVQAFKWNGAVWEDYGRRITAESAGDGTGILESLSLSHDGSVLAVGSQYADDGGSNSGKVRLFNWTGNDWSQLGANLVGFVAGAKLSRPVLSADGNIVAVGAVRESAGTVRVYRWDGVAWRQLGNTLEGDAAGDQFGYSVAMSDDGYSLLIGAFDNDSGGGGSGQAKLFRLVGDYWEQLGSTLNGTVALEHLGVNVDVSSDASRFVVSGSYQGHNSQPGVARVYDVTATESSVSVASDVVSIEVRGVNDPPVLQIGQSVSLAQVQEDSGAPVGAVGSLVSELIDASGPRNNFSDVDGDLPGIAIVEQDLQGGTLWHSLDNGVTWEAVGNASEGEPFLLFSDSATRLYYQPAADFSGTLASVVKFRAWDGNASWEKVGLDLVGSGDGDLFGRSVAISADGLTVAVGGYRNDQNGADAGEVRVYRWIGGAWTQFGEDILGDTAGDNLGFQTDLSADGQRLVVGMGGSDVNGTDTGAVRVFEWSGTAWVQLGSNIVGTNPGDEFGHSLSMSKDGSTIALGSTVADYVDVFQWNGSVWQQQGQRFTETYLGSVGTLSLSKDGTVIALGAAGPDDTPANSGVVRVFQWFNNEWVQLGNEIQGDLEGGFFSRTSLSADGMTLAVGAHSGSGGGVYSGAGYVRIFRYSSSGWQQMGADLVGNNWSDRFGWSVSLSENGSRIVVGSDLSDGNHFAGGEVQAFRWDGAGWLTEGQIINGAANLSRIGISVDSSANGNIFVAGSYQENASGRASVFRRVAAPGSTSSEIGELSVEVLPVNDAPVLNTNSLPALGPIAEDAGVPVGQVGTLVSSLIDTGGPLNNFSDIDGDLPGIAITGTNLQGGALWYSTDDGATWLDVGAVSETEPQLLAADANTRVYFQPAADFNGTISDVITMRAWDRTGQWDQSSTNLLGEAAGDGFGHSVALSGDGLTAIVGGLSNDGSGSNAGHVQVYRRADETAAWFQLGPDFEGENAGDAEGFSVAISADGNTVAFGTPRSDDAFLNAGQVRIFRWDGTQWTQLGTDINGIGTGECSGWAIDLNEHGDILAIGGVSDPADTVRGQTRVYKYVDSAWTQVGSDIPGEAVGDWSGHSVRLSGDGEIVAIGASHNGPDTGHVRVFSWNGSVWLQQGSDIDGEDSGDQFGHSVAMSQDGKFVAIGAPHNSDGGSLAGHVRVLQWNAMANAWQQIGADLDGESAGDRYGGSVAISDDGKLLAIGAHGAHNFTGHVSVYQWTGSGWENLPHVSAYGLSDREFFGLSVDLSSNGQTMIVGAPSTPLSVASTSSNSGYSEIFSLAPALNALSNSADTVAVTVVPENDDPTLDVLSDVNINEDDPEQTVSLTGIAAGGGEIQQLEVTAVSDNTGLIPDPTVTFDGQSSTGTLKFTPVADQFGTATITVTVTDGGLDNDLGTPEDNGVINRTVFIGVAPINDAPTLDALSDININEDDPEQTINLTGITVGGGETQLLSVTAVSDNTGLIPDPTVDFDGQSSTGTLKFTPLADQFGTATITVTVEDGGLDDDLGTPDDNGFINRTVTVITEAVNEEPTLDALSDVNITEDDPEQTVNLTGITAGGGETQVLSVTATSDNTGLIPDPTVDFDGQSATGTLKFTPVADQFGTATITVTVEDGGLDNDLGTPEDNGVINRTVTVITEAVNDEPTLDALSDININEDDPEQTVNLTGITTGGGETQVLSITAVSDNTGLIPDPTVDFDGQSSTGTLKFTPVADQFGTATITVTVTDGGLDNDLATPGDNGVINRTVVVKAETVNDEPTLDALSEVTINEDDSEQTINLAGITAGGGETQVLSVTATSDNTGLIPDPTVDFDGQSSTATLKFTPVADQSGTATITVTVEDGGLDNDLGTPDDNGFINRTVTVITEAVNDDPTLDALSDVNITEDDPEQTVNLTGITAGGGETQVLSITAVSDNTGLIPDSTVDFDGQSLSGTLKFTPVANQFGTATITVTVEDNGLDNDLATPEDNGAIQRTVVVAVAPVNDTPTLDSVADMVLPEDSLTQALDITGITAGGSENQPLQVTALSSNQSLVIHPTVTSRPALGADVRLLTVTPLPDQYGIATITVTVEDGGLDLDLNTAEDNAIFSRTFDVTVTPDTDDVPSPVTPHGKMFIHETLSGDPLVSYQLPAVNVNGEAINGLVNRITATSSDTALIPEPTVIYASADVPSSLSFTPVADANGTATLSIQVEDGGPDNNFATTEDNRQTTHQVVVNVLEVISNRGSAILAKDSTENLYVNTQPVVYHDQQQAQSTVAGFAAIGATSEGGGNALLVERASVTNRLVTDDAWRINGLFHSLQNESSPVLDLTAREVSSTLNVVAVAGAYEINGARNPTLVVRRGQIYNFNLNVANHPFYLQTTGNGFHPENAFNRFFQGQGRTAGEYMWIVPADAPDELYYQCEFHPVMFGKIIVID